jgi:excisionase family DNA binding protein
MWTSVTLATLGTNVRDPAPERLQRTEDEMTDQFDDDVYLTPGEVAQLFRVNPKTVARWAKEGKLPFIQTLGGHRRYPSRAIRTLLESLHQSPVSRAS